MNSYSANQLAARSKQAHQGVQPLTLPQNSSIQSEPIVPTTTNLTHTSPFFSGHDYAAAANAALAEPLPLSGNSGVLTQEDEDEHELPSTDSIRHYVHESGHKNDVWQILNSALPADRLTAEYQKRLYKAIKAVLTLNKDQFIADAVSLAKQLKIHPSQTHAPEFSRFLESVRVDIVVQSKTDACNLVYHRPQ